MRKKTPWFRRSAKGGGWELEVAVTVTRTDPEPMWSFAGHGATPYPLPRKARVARVLKRKPDAWQMFLLDDVQHPRCIGEQPTKARAMAVCEAIVAMEG